MHVVAVEKVKHPTAKPAEKGAHVATLETVAKGRSIFIPHPTRKRNRIDAEGKPISVPVVEEFGPGSRVELPADEVRRLRELQFLERPDEKELERQEGTSAPAAVETSSTKRGRHDVWDWQELIVMLKRETRSFESMAIFEEWVCDNVGRADGKLRGNGRPQMRTVRAAICRHGLDRIAKILGAN